MKIEVVTTPASPNISLDPADLKFGQIFAPSMFNMCYRDGDWHEPRVERLHNLSLHPATSVLHYGQEIFEGLKAYRHPDSSVHLFRPRDNFERMNLSAERMSMPTFDVDLALEGLHELIKVDHQWVPVMPGALYIRPTMIATRVGLGVVPAEDYQLFIITSPVGAYFGGTSNQLGSVSIYVSENYTRAAPGGTGMAKAGGNYAGSMKAIKEGLQTDCQQVLFLSATEPKSVEELGGMNICLVKDDVLITPPLTDGTILNGVTRRSILRLASDFMETSEQRVLFDDLLEGIKSGAVSEIFICGTGAGIVAVTSLKHGSVTLDIADRKPGPVTQKLFDLLTGIQFGLIADKFNWLDRVI